MATTTNFGWETPDDTDLVKDGALAIRTLGNSIDTSLVDLKGGTTGQVLSKASNTDMDFTWTTDATGIPATIFDAKGDLIVASAADTAARLAAATNGYTLVTNSATATGLEWVASSTNRVLLDSGTLSGASVTTATLSTGYKELQVYIKQWRPATDSAELYLRWNGLTTGYNYELVSGGGIDAGLSSTSARIARGTDNGTSRGLTWIVFPDYSNTTTMKMGEVHTLSTAPNNPTTEFSYCNGISMNYDTAAITTLTFFPSTGNFTSGSYEVYGVK